MAKIPQINIRFGADTRPLKRGVSRSQGMIAGLTASITSGFMNAAAAVGRFATTLVVDGVKAAIEDAKGQRILAKQLQKTTKATDKQVESVEAWISSLSMARGIADDELRPALARLVRSTQHTGKAQKLLRTALDISSATGKDLNTVTAALGKAYDGNAASLGRLGLGLDASVLKSKDFNLIWKELTKSFGGFNAAEANTTEGKLARLNVQWDEMQEKLGEAVLPALEDVVAFLNSPEGQEAIKSFAEDFSQAAQALAENMPTITREVGNIVDKASEMDWESFLGMAKWAAAFKIGSKVPGPIQIKVLAALAAYMGTDLMTGEHDLTAGKAMMDVMQGKRGAAAGSVWDWQKQYAQQGYLSQGNVNITVNGALDPNATAKAVQKALNQHRRSTGGLSYYGRGTG